MPRSVRATLTGVFRRLRGTVDDGPRTRIVSARIERAPHTRVPYPIPDTDEYLRDMQRKGRVKRFDP